MNTVTCHTPDCENADIGIELELSWVNFDTGETEWVTGVSCGACGEPITDIDPPLPDPEPEPDPDVPDNTLPEPESAP